MGDWVPGEGDTMLKPAVGNSNSLRCGHAPYATLCHGLISPPFPSCSWSWPRPRTT